MEKKKLLQFKNKLEKEKEILRKELSSFAKEDTRPKGDWDTIFPKSDDTDLDSQIQKVEKYINLLPVEHSLELRLKNINLSLEKIEKGRYGICEKCKKSISMEKLKICPETKFCKNCQKA